MFNTEVQIKYSVEGEAKIPAINIPGWQMILESVGLLVKKRKREKMSWSGFNKKHT